MCCYNKCVPRGGAFPLFFKASMLCSSRLTIQFKIKKIYNPISLKAILKEVISHKGVFATEGTGLCHFSPAAVTATSAQQQQYFHIAGFPITSLLKSPYWSSCQVCFGKFLEIWRQSLGRVPFGEGKKPNRDVTL